jgi:peptidoglycan/xylan/chitin deacetylase (PgdA/CDA1 family)
VISPARAVVSSACRRGGAPCLSVLIYHRVLEQPDFMLPGDVTREEFRRQMELVGRLFNVLDLGEAVERLFNGTLPERALCITFDDGYADTHDIGCPVLETLGLPATFFVATAYLDGGRMWNDTVIEALRRETAERIDLGPLGLGLGWADVSTPQGRKAAADKVIQRLRYLPNEARSRKADWFRDRLGKQLPCDLMMTAEQIRGLDTRGMGIGAHTETHPILALLERDEAIREIRRGKERLEQILGKRVNLFAYPNGKFRQDFTVRDVELVASLGFKAALTAEAGVSCRSTPRFGLRRFTPWDRGTFRFAARMVLNCRHRL